MLSFIRRPIIINKNALYKRSIFINTETTPNPQSLKFLPGEVVLPESFGTGMKSPLVKNLFSIEGIKGVFLGREFITITKLPEESWQALKPQVFSKILDFLAEGKPAIFDTPPVTDTTILETDDEIVASIKELLETRIRPSVQDDGGDIFYEGFDLDTGIVKLRLAGSCVGCPSSSVTLKQGVENMLKHYIPEVKGIEEVKELDDAQVLQFQPETPSVSDGSDGAEEEEEGPMGAPRLRTKA